MYRRSAVGWIGVATALISGCESDTGEGVDLPTFGEIAVESAPGVVTGTWSASGVVVEFMAVSLSEAESFATFQLQGAEGGLAVDVASGEVASITWQGVAIDGYGELTPEEASALDDLLGGALWDALATVPIELACREDTSDLASTAALVLPLQLALKYRRDDREPWLRALAAASSCGHVQVDPTEPDERPAATVLNMSNDSLVPVVFGFFPFDEDGAADLADPGILAPLLLPSPTPAPIGPCKSLCRGACGADCTRRNCTVTREWRCVQAADGSGNTGRKEEWSVFNCGVHPGCVWHDQCFDDCNAAHPCGSWRAALCRHNPHDGCDVTASETYGYLECVKWAHGWGTFTHRQDFAYPVPYSDVYDALECPTSTVVDQLPDFNICSVSINITGTYTDSHGETRDDDELLMIGNWHNDLDQGGKPVYFGGMSGNNFIAELAAVTYANGSSSGRISLAITFDEKAGTVAAFSASRYWQEPYGYAFSGKNVPAENPAAPFADDRFIGGAYDPATAGPMVDLVKHTHEDYVGPGPYAGKDTYTLGSYTVKSVTISCVVSDER